MGAQIMNKNKLFFIILICLMILMSCAQRDDGNHSPADVNQMSGTEECMPLLFPAGYIRGETYEGEPVTDLDLPPSNWQLVTVSPQALNESWYSNRSIAKLANTFKLVVIFPDETLGVYDTENSSWEIINYPSTNNLIARVSNETLYLNEDFEVNDHLTVYEFDFENSNFIKHVIAQPFNVRTLVSVISKGTTHWAVFDIKDGGFLVGHFTLEEDELNASNFYELYPSTDMTPFLKYDENGRPSLSLEMDSEDSLYVTTVGNPELNSNLDGVVYKILKTGEKELITMFTSRVGFNEYPRAYADIRLDDNNNLWVSDYLWVDLNSKLDNNGNHYYPNRYVMYRSPVFITNKPNPAFEIVWNTPSPQTSTPDGRIWYQSLRGTAWFQPKTGEWCMFSSSQSNIVKDSDGNLWMVYDNALYMLPASETSKKE
jgi:hypothetical protein